MDNGYGYVNQLGLTTCMLKEKKIRKRMRKEIITDLSYLKGHLQ